MIYLIIEIFVILAIASNFFTLILALMLRNRLKNSFRPIYIFVLVNSALVLLEILFNFIYQNTNPIHHFSTFIISFIILYYFFFLNVHRRLVRFFFIMSCLIFIYETFYLMRIMETNFLMSISSNIIISIISFLHLFELHKNDCSDFKFKYHIAVSFFVFNTSCFFVSLFESQIREEMNYLLAIVYPIYSGLIIFQNIMLSRGIWTLKKI
jgi:hypothetical protein